MFSSLEDSPIDNTERWNICLLLCTETECQRFPTFKQTEPESSFEVVYGVTQEALRHPQELRLSFSWNHKECYTGTEASCVPDSAGCTGPPASGSLRSLQPYILST